jgi:hypothetical protein
MRTDIFVCPKKSRQECLFYATIVSRREPVGQTFLSVPVKYEQAGMPVLLKLLF